MMWITSFVIFTLLLGYVGALGVVGAYIASRLYAKKELENSYSDYLFKQRSMELETVDELDRAQNTKDETSEELMDIISYKEILASEDEELKISLIGILVSNPSRENIALLKFAMSDANETIRIMASNSIQSIDDKYTLQMGKLLKEAKTARETHELESLYYIYLDLAKLYDEYFYSGLPSEEMRDFYLQKMFEFYEAADYLKPHHRWHIGGYVRALIKYDALEVAKSIIKWMKETEGVSEELKVWEMEISFKERNFKELKEKLQDIELRDIKNGRLKKALEWWGSEHSNNS